MKKWIAWLLCLVLAMVPVSAKSSAELQKELDALKSQAADLADESAALEADLEAARSETQSVIEQKSAIDRQIHMTEQEIQNTNDQILQYGLLIAQKQSELEDAEEAHREMNETCKIRLRAMEESGPVSYWSVLFQANSFSDLLDRINMIHEIAEADQRMLDALKASARQLEADRNALKHDLAAQQEAKTALTALEADLQSQRAEADALLLQLAAAEAALSDEYLAMLEQEEQLMQAVIEAQAAYEDALSAEEAARLASQNQNNAAGSASGGSVTAATSGFTSPIPSGTWVTSAFGPRIHPLYGYNSNHTGVDLAANRGTAICAIASGTVTLSTYHDVWGNYASLSHGNGYGSMYAHMDSCVVSAGDYVNQGEVIGFVGTTGWSSGPHLHFEIYVNGAPVNPAEYVGF